MSVSDGHNVWADRFFRSRESSNVSMFTRYKLEKLKGNETLVADESYVNINFLSKPDLKSDKKKNWSQILVLHEAVISMFRILLALAIV